MKNMRIMNRKRVYEDVVFVNYVAIAVALIFRRRQRFENRRLILTRKLCL
jgi:hypothetical protein